MKHRISIARDLYEKENCGGYVKIYPCEDKEYYDSFMRTAREQWENFTKSRPPSAFRRIRKIE